MSKSDQFTIARAQLVLGHPFFGALALRLKAIPDPGIPTACTDGSWIRYNPDFVAGLTREQTVGLIAHECMHPAMLHHTRQGSRDAERWNIACDYAINGILKTAGFTLPNEVCIDAKYDGMCAEEIYPLLPKQPPKGCNGGPGDPGGCGGVVQPREDGGREPTASEIAEMEADWKVTLAQAAHLAKQMGKLPAGMERLIDATLEPVVNWREELHRFCKTPKPADSSWARPNRRFVHQGLYLPSVTTENVGKFCCVIDTSGSIGEKELNEFGSEIQGIVDQLKPEEVIVIYCDAAVAHVDRFGPYDELKFKAHGGGGTDFRPPFHWLEKHEIKPDALVYLTDGYGEFPKDEAEFPTLWAINNRNVIPPWGHHLVLEV